MEPASAPTPVRPAPIMDVAPPAVRSVGQASAPATAQPSATALKPANTTAQPQPTGKSELNKPAATSKPTKPKSSMNAAIIVALMVFLALSGLAFYAYTKSNK